MGCSSLLVFYMIMGGLKVLRKIKELEGEVQLNKIQSSQLKSQGPWCLLLALGTLLQGAIKLGFLRS